jgi:hypothetical protein
MRSEVGDQVGPLFLGQKLPGAPAYSVVSATVIIPPPQKVIQWIT